MPKLPRISGAEVQRASSVWALSKYVGSHVIMKRETKGCVVPMHKEVKVGTLAGILRRAEVSPEEFLAALQE
jgi:predicted RNA binding protein YcfA (HicA-like mRNA interferase family)